MQEYAQELFEVNFGDLIFQLRDIGSEVFFRQCGQLAGFVQLCESVVDGCKQRLCIVALGGTGIATIFYLVGQSGVLIFASGCAFK